MEKPKPYRIAIYSPNDLENPVMDFESDLPFMDFNIGDFIDSAYNDDYGEQLGFTKENKIQVSGVAHLIASAKGVFSHYKKIYTKFVTHEDAHKRIK